MMGRLRGVVVAVLVPVLALTAAGCTNGSKLPPDVLQAGQVDIQLPPGWKVVHDQAVAPDAAAAGAAEPTAGASTTTIPLAKQNPTTAFFQATSEFSSCLKGLGVTFVGTPNASDPSSPANDPTYLKVLEKCAAQSNILQALKNFQNSQSNLTSSQIQQENKQYLAWRTCMIGRGWTIPAPTPNAQGELFSVDGAETGSQFTPPPGQNILNSPDIQACAQQAQLGKKG